MVQRGQAVNSGKWEEMEKEVYILCIYSVTNASAPRNRHYSYAITRFYYFKNYVNFIPPPPLW